MIIGLIGKAGSGKTTIANMIAKKVPTTILSFATPLKQMIEKAGICSHNELFVEKTWFSRKMLQLIGTDFVKNQINQDFWILKMLEQVVDAQKQFPLNHILIDDVRFRNEIDYIKDHNDSLIIRIERPDLISKDTHISETSLDDITTDYCIWNSYGIKELEEIISDIIKFAGLAK